jgi:hypothetical protein
MDQESMLVGGSSGATIAAMEAMRERIRPGATCVAIFPDGGDRYLDTIYSDSWVRGHFGDVATLWADPRTTLEMVQGTVKSGLFPTTSRSGSGAA